MKKNKTQTKTSLKFRLLCYLLCFILLVAVLLRYINDRVMPSVEKTMEMYGVNKSMSAIDGAVKSVIGQSGLTAKDLYTESVSGNGKLTSLSANTVLINGICADIAAETMERLSRLSEQTVYLPLGTLMGIDFLATKGPPVLRITAKPLGNCHVDYKTSFKSEGINQVNYQIWIEIRANVAVVNPLMSRDITVEKNLPIVNTYISGEVPNSMMYPFDIN